MTLRADRVLPRPQRRGRGTTSGAIALDRLSPRESTWRRAAPRCVLIMLAVDLVLACSVVTVLTLGRYDVGQALALGALAAAVFVVTTAVSRGYRRFVAGTADVRGLLHAAGALGVASLGLQGFGVLDLPHALVLHALVLTVGFATLTRLLLRRILTHLRAEGRLARRTLLVGPLTSLRPAFDSLDEARFHGMTVVGICTPEQSASDAPSTIVGTYDNVSQTVTDLAVDTVIVSADAMDAAALRRLGWRLRSLPVELLVLPPLTDVVPRRLRIEPMAGTPLLAVSFTESRAQRVAKSLVDRAIGSLILLGVLPIIAVAGIAVRLTSRGPAFFSQTRIGLDGQPFTMHKLRSMYIDAEDRLAELKERSDGNGLLFKMHDDPRVTRVGKTLRRLSIDELPQLWNVVKGDMSLVGPRPALPSEVAAYEGDVAQRLHVKPGLTGLWQVSGRSNLSLERSIRLDLRYADNWSVGMDAHILLRTARAVVGGDGAY